MVKQVIVMRKDLNMRKGKMVSQSCHASLAIFTNRGKIKRSCNGNEMIINLTPDMLEWLEESFTKICVGVDSEEELLEIHRQARDAKLPCSLIKDAGNTEFHGIPTYTCVAIGPSREDKIDKITGKLKLL
jgi:PTH2 family peptidyl-tRNA hydrolase